MNSLLYPLCASVAWVSLLFKLPAVFRRDRGPGALAVALFFLFMGLTFTISDPRVWAWLDGLTGVPNLALLLSQGSVICVAASQLTTLTHWAHPPERARPRVRRQLWAFAAVLAAMTLLFALADLTEEDTTRAAVRYAGTGLYSVYLMIYVTAFAVTQAALVVFCLRHARSVGLPWLGRGLRLATAGACGGLLYCLVRYLDVVGPPLFGFDPQRWEFLAQVGAGVGGILTLVGWSVPGWGPQLSALRDHLRDQRVYRRLYPLWAELLAANPDLALDPDARPGTVRDLNFRLHRRVVEIRDGKRWLRPYHDQGAVDAAERSATARGLAGDELRAHTEAVAIAAALAAARADAPHPAPAPQAGPLDSDAEAAWLAKVADAFTALESR